MGGSLKSAFDAARAAAAERCESLAIAMYTMQ